jgi:hypothetical protein
MLPKLEENYTIKNSKGHKYILKPFQTNKYILENPLACPVRCVFDVSAKMECTSIELEGSPTLQKGKYNIEKIEILDLENKEIVQITGQVGISTTFLITFKNGLVPHDIRS